MGQLAWALAQLTQLERSVHYGWMAFQVSNHQAIGQLLPDLIREAQAAVWQLGGDDQRAAQAWLAWTYQLTAATAFKLGDAQLGWVAADRGIQLAEQTENLTLIGSAARWVAHALIDTYRSGDAVTLVRSAADRLAPHCASDEVRCRQITHQLIEDLVHSYPRGSQPSPALANVARAVGVTV
jgi:hypothetical protein